jgi:hypothetical protein
VGNSLSEHRMTCAQGKRFRMERFAMRVSSEQFAMKVSSEHLVDCASGAHQNLHQMD